MRCCSSCAGGQTPWKRPSTFWRTCPLPTRPRSSARQTSSSSPTAPPQPTFRRVAMWWGCRRRSLPRVCLPASHRHLMPPACLPSPPRRPPTPHTPLPTPFLPRSQFLPRNSVIIPISALERHAVQEQRTAAALPCEWWNVTVMPLQLNMQARPPCFLLCFLARSHPSSVSPCTPLALPRCVSQLDTEPVTKTLAGAPDFRARNVRNRLDIIMNKNWRLWQNGSPEGARVRAWGLLQARRGAPPPGGVRCHPALPPHPHPTRSTTARLASLPPSLFLRTRSPREHVPPPQLPR